MKYRVLDSFKAQTKQGEVMLQAGQTITLPHGLALSLLGKRKIEPVEKVATRIYSKVLEAHLWVVADDQQSEVLRTTGEASEPIYTMTEARELKKLLKSELPAVHLVKQVFPSSKVECVVQKDLPIK